MISEKLLYFEGEQILCKIVLAFKLILI
jgi:hypothetical protein